MQVLPRIPLKSEKIKKYYIVKYKTIPIVPKKPKVNEELGKTFEMAICILYGIKYTGVFKYSMKNAKSLSIKLTKLRYYISHLEHLGSRPTNDFKTDIGFLNAKTTRGDGKVCPQVIGQPCLESFCNYFGCNKEKIKSFVETNINIILEEYIENTFSSPIVYYNEKTNTIILVRIIDTINWENYPVNFSHIKNNKEWNESTTLYFDNKSLGEFQIHKNRDCIKFRWKFENLLKMFPENFKIIDIY